MFSQFLTHFIYIRKITSPVFKYFDDETYLELVAFWVIDKILFI